MSCVTALFWLSSGLLGYVYVGYPVLLRALAYVAGRPVLRDASVLPTVTVVISAYNEQKNIADKIDNVLTLEYPETLLDVIVVSDASSDSTDAIVSAYVSRRVKLLRVEGRQGKTACQNLAVKCATGDLILFTDATTLIDKAALLKISANFADKEVGCVAGALIYEPQGRNVTAVGGTSYWTYEMGLRSAESQLGTLVGVSGCLYGVRRPAYRPIAPELISDFVIAMRIREQGLRTVLEPGALCYESTLSHASEELTMRVRVVNRTIAALLAESAWLNPLKDPLFAWELWSHKVLRYASPWLWGASLITSAFLAGHDWFYAAVFLIQSAVLVAGIAGFVLQTHSGSLRLLSKPYYFLLSNLASLLATLAYARGRRVITWETVR